MEPANIMQTLDNVTCNFLPRSVEKALMLPKPNDFAERIRFSNNFEQALLFVALPFRCFRITLWSPPPSDVGYEEYTLAEKF